MKLTKHAQTRMDQRGLTEGVMYFLEAFGEEEHQKGGTHRVFMPDRQRKKAIKAAKKVLSLLENSRSPYFVVSDDDKVITAAFLYS